MCRSSGACQPHLHEILGALALAWPVRVDRLRGTMRAEEVDPMSLKTRLLTGLSVLGWLCASPAFAGSAAEKVAMFAVRLTTEPQVLAGCQRTGRVSDSSMEDLRKKIVRS